MIYIPSYTNNLETIFVIIMLLYNCGLFAYNINVCKKIIRKNLLNKYRILKIFFFLKKRKKKKKKKKNKINLCLTF
jgi:hypothetical protein